MRTEAGPLRAWEVTGLLLVVAAGAAARFWALDFGLPLVRVRPDEQLVITKAIEFAEGDLSPRFFDYPALYFYLLAGLYRLYYLWGLVAGWFESLEHFISTWPTHWEPFFRIGRVVGAVSGTATVAVVWAIGRRLLGRGPALVAALFLSLAFLHVRDSHYATTDAPMVLLLMAAFHLLVRAWQDGRTRDYVLAGTVAGLAAATKYNAVLLALPMLAVATYEVLDAPGSKRAAIGRSRLPHLLVPFALVFLVTNPYVLLDFATFRRDMDALSASHARGMTPPEMLGIGWRYHLMFSLRHGLGLPLLVTGLSGLIGLVVGRPRVGLLVAAFPVSYYAVVGGGYLVFVRYMMPVVPFLCLAAAAAVAWLGRRARPIGELPVTVALAAALIWPSLVSVARFDALLARRDSRLVAGDWVHANVPAGATIYQAGALYGHLQLEATRNFKYRHWTWDRDASRFRGPDRELRDDWPDWIVVHESALPYSHVPPPVAARLGREYALVHTERAVDAREPRNVYDIQDAFFMPYGGFVEVRRPGPNVLIYRTRASAVVPRPGAPSVSLGRRAPGTWRTGRPA